MTALGAAEEVAGAAQLQVAQRDAEPGPEAGVLLEGVEALAGLGVDRLLLRYEEERVALARRAPDAAAQLVQLRDAEVVRPVNEDGVRAGDVEAAFDDGRGEKHVRVAAREAAHLLGEDRRGHLAVGDLDLRLRNERAQPRGHLVDGHHAVVQEIDLPAARELALDRAAHHGVGSARDRGVGGDALARGRAQQRQVAHSRHGEVERARDWRGAHGQHVRRGPQAL